MRKVKVTFGDDLLEQVDRAAKQESRSRSALIRDAVGSYVERKRRWAAIMRKGRHAARSRGLTIRAVEDEIASVRKARRP
jgi:metal-responsive CopG/Arc/MetJ family transcriptional regulator